MVTASADVPAQITRTCEALRQNWQVLRTLGLAALLGVLQQTHAVTATP